MFLTRKHLSRRTLPKGAGVGLALPLLDAMIPAGTALAQTVAARSNMSNSDTHSTHPLPTHLIGGGGGKLSGGRHLASPQPTPIANLHLTLLDRVGVERKTFGDSTGTISL